MRSVVSLHPWRKGSVAENVARARPMWVYAFQLSDRALQTGWPCRSMCMTSDRLRMMRLWLCFVAVCFASITSSRVFAQTAASPVCDPSPEVKAELDSVPDDYVYPEYWRHYQQRRLAAIQAVLDRHPDDFFARRAYERWVIAGEQDVDKLQAEDKAAYEQHPDDPADAYFYAVLLVGRDTPTAIKILDSILQKHPDFPW